MDGWCDPSKMKQSNLTQIFGEVADIGQEAQEPVYRSLGGAADDGDAYLSSSAANDAAPAFRSLGAEDDSDFQSCSASDDPPGPSAAPAFRSCSASAYQSCSASDFQSCSASDGAASSTSNKKPRLDESHTVGCPALVAGGTRRLRRAATARARHAFSPRDTPTPCPHTQPRS